MSSEIEKPAEIIKLSQNENAFGASPLALKAIEAHYRSVYRYPDPLHKELAHKIADKYNVTPGNVIVSAGSVALIDISIKTFVNMDENIITAEVTWVGFKIMAKINRIDCKLAKLVDNTIDLQNMLSLCDDRTKLVFIANPNNPTGTLVTHNDMKKFLQTIRPDIYVVIDEAYAEYITDSEYPDSFELQKEFPNLIIFRSFSKIYGLAGLRIGYAIAHPDIIGSLAQHKTPFSISSLAAVAASAALDDTEYIKKCAAVNAEEREILYAELRSMGLNATVPKGNFIFVEFDTPNENDKACELLKSEGILVRPLGPFGAERALRITVGRPEENRHLIRCLKKIA